MATFTDIGLAAAINILSALVFLVAFVVSRLQPINDRVYFSKWYLKGARSSPNHSGTFVHKFVNLNLRSYLRFLEWMPAALKMPELELIDHAGLDSAVFLRIYLIGYSIYVLEVSSSITFHLACSYKVYYHTISKYRSLCVTKDIEKFVVQILHFAYLNGFGALSNFTSRN
ncbi:hypothetical protein BHE74_00037500 [Ensete ventricosum]|nr:hypothetical protein GW17_00000653 [Ensete ventricosum]RWW55836.1 hypothetical protein BHE74_00037500 [Ensete ventricosum]RZS02521.1 hypothetical protein BHM03_00032574 [Ensete ventricosum]